MGKLKQWFEPEKLNNYDEAKRSPLRHIANPKVIIPVTCFVYLSVCLLSNFVIYHVVNLGYQFKEIFGLEGYEYSVLKGLFFFRFPMLQIPIYLILGVLTFINYYKLKQAYRPLEDELVQGTQRFTEPEEVEQQYPAISVSPENPEEDYYEGKPGFPVARLPQTEEEKETGEFRLAIDREPSHSITLAHTRGGKGIFSSDPLIDTISRARKIEDRHSFITTSTKGDEVRKWYPLLKSRGYIIRVLNTVDQFYSDPYNPFNAIKDFYEKAVLAKELIKKNQYEDRAMHDMQAVASMYFKEEQGGGGKDAFWTKASRSLFLSMAVALLHQSVMEKKNELLNGYTIYNTVNKMFSEKISETEYEYLKQYARDRKHLKKLIEKYDGKSTLDVYFEEMEDKHPAKIYYYGMKASAPAKSTLGNIVTHFNGSMELFLQSGNAKMTAIDDGFRFTSLGFDNDQPTAVFVIVSDAEESNNELAMMYIEQAYQSLHREAFASLSGKTERDVDVIVEEAGNVGALPNLLKKWGAAAGRGIFFHLVLQDIEQLTELYGNSAKSIIVGNTGNLVYIRSGSLDTNKYISERLGKRANYSMRRQKETLATKSSETEESERIDLKSPFELENLMFGETIVLRLMHTHDNNKKPIYQAPLFNTFENDTNLFPFYEYRDLEAVPWEELPINNSFMEMDRTSLLWTLNKDIYVPGAIRVPISKDFDLSKPVNKVKPKAKKVKENQLTSMEKDLIDASLENSMPLEEATQLDFYEDLMMSQREQLYDSTQVIESQDIHRVVEPLSNNKDSFLKINEETSSNKKISDMLTSQDVMRIRGKVLVLGEHLPALISEFDKVMESDQYASLLTFVVTNLNDNDVTEFDKMVIKSEEMTID